MLTDTKCPAGLDERADVRHLLEGRSRRLHLADGARLKRINEMTQPLPIPESSREISAWQPLLDHLLHPHLGLRPRRGISGEARRRRSRDGHRYRAITDAVPRGRL